MWWKCLRWSTLGEIYHSYTGNVFSLFCKAHHYFLITLFISIREIDSGLEGISKFFTNDVSFFINWVEYTEHKKNEKIFNSKTSTVNFIIIVGYKFKFLLVKQISLEVRSRQWYCNLGRRPHFLKTFSSTILAKPKITMDSLTSNTIILDCRLFVKNGNVKAQIKL